MDYNIDDLEALIVDVLDGEDAYDIMGMTGLSYERAEEIYELSKEVIKNCLKKRGLK